MTQFLFGFSQKKKVPVKLFFEKKKKNKKSSSSCQEEGNRAAGVVEESASRGNACLLISRLCARFPDIYLLQAFSWKVTRRRRIISFFL